MDEAKKLIFIAGIMILFQLVAGYTGSIVLTQTIVFASFLAFIVKFGLAVGIYLRNPREKSTSTLR